MGLLEDLFQIGDGVRSGIEDAPSFIVNILSGDVHGAVTDGRNLIGDVTGILDGVQGLGVSLGEVPRRYLGSAAKLADSKILAAAQLAIEGQKALTGSGDPDEGNGYRESGRRLEDTVETLIDAAPHDDRWDGAAAKAYRTANDVHRRRASSVQTADTEIARIIGLEAAQVRRTRETLDDVSQNLYDFGLATSWMNFVPGMAAAKAAADIATAAAAMATTNGTVAILVKNSAENALGIRRAERAYLEAIAAVADEDRAAEATPELAGPCGALIKQSDDLAQLPQRIAEQDTYKVPDADPPWGPPATPYSAAPSHPSAGAPPRTGTSPPQPKAPRISVPATPKPTAAPPGAAAAPADRAGFTGQSTGRAPEPIDRKNVKKAENR